MEKIKLIPISADEKEMEPYIAGKESKEVFDPVVQLYARVGCCQPWICYWALANGEVIGACGFKGKPVNGRLEIAYGTYKQYEGKGYAAEMCRLLTDIALQHGGSVRITARTLMQENASTRILKKNGYVFAGVVTDPEDGEVWEWEYPA